MLLLCILCVITIVLYHFTRIEQRHAVGKISVNNQSIGVELRPSGQNKFALNVGVLPSWYNKQQDVFKNNNLPVAIHSGVQNNHGTQHVIQESNQVGATLARENILSNGSLVGGGAVNSNAGPNQHELGNNILGINTTGGGAIMERDANANDSSILYVTEYKRDRVIACDVIKSSYNSNSAGGNNHSHKIPTNVNNCKVAQSNLNGPENMLINGRNLYIVTYWDSGITDCTLNTLGSIVGCTHAFIPLESPVYITQPSANQIYINAYPESGMAQIVGCTITGAGKLNDCGNKAIISEKLLPKVLVNNYTYKTNWKENAVEKCMGVTCKFLTNIIISGPLSIYVSQNTAYIANDDSLVGCGVDASSGDFFACKILATGLAWPVGIAQYNAS